MIKFTLWLIGAAVLASQPILAQQDSRKIVEQSIEWVSVNSNLTLTRRLSILLDGQFRQVNQLDPQQYQARTALEVKLNDHFSIIPLGYVYTWNYQYGKQPADFVNHEHRVWQQVAYKHKIGRIHFEHRLRSEQRFLQHHTSNNGEVSYDGYSDIQYRGRYRFSARVPLNGTKIESGTYFASVYDEVFASRGKNITYHKPDQNRVFAGLGYQFDKSFTLQGGFLYQMLLKSGGTLQENNFGVQVQFLYNIDLTHTH
ncbi:MAG: DUF2490 domain-containing protein [Chryseolinea sp.]